MDQKEMSSRGGKATSRRFKGTDHYVKLGQKSVEIRKKKYGPDLFRKIRRGIKVSEEYPENLPLDK